MEEESELHKIFVGGVSWITTDEILRDHFSKFGTVARAVVARDRFTGTPRGFGFVSFTQEAAVAKVLQVETHVILGRTVDVKKAIPRGEQCPNQLQNIRNNGRSNGRNNEQFTTKKIFVGGLSANLTEDEFRNYFEQFGRITDVVVMHDNMTQRPRGFGFITFDSEDAVEEVMTTSFHEIGGKQAEVKRAVPKEGNHSGYNARGGVRRGSNLNNYQNGNLQPYSPRNGHGHLSRYGTQGYGGNVGYPYGAGFFGVGFPIGGYNGFGYGMAPFAPMSSWNTRDMFGFTRNPYPVHFYSGYMNGGVEAMGVHANGYHGNSSQRGGGGETQTTAVDRKSPHMNGGNVDNNFLGSSGSADSATSEQIEVVNNGRLAASSASDSS